MQIIRGKPIARGVTALEYVGDSDDTSVVLDQGGKNELIAGAAALLVAIATKGATRLLAGGLAAGIALRGISSFARYR